MVPTKSSKPRWFGQVCFSAGVPTGASFWKFSSALLSGLEGLTVMFERCHLPTIAVW